MQAEAIPEGVAGVGETGAWFDRGRGMPDAYARAVPLVPVPWEERLERFPAVVARVFGELALRREADEWLGA